VNQRWVRILGSSLSILALAFLAYRFQQQRAREELRSLGSRAWLAVLAGALISVLASVIQAASWRKSLGAGAPRLLRAWVIYGKSQIGKYLPGNVFHFAGRQVLGARAGVPHSVLLFSSGFEILSLVVAAAFVGGWGVVRFGWLERLPGESVMRTALAVGAAIALLGGVLLLRFAPRHVDFVRRIGSTSLLSAHAYHWLFFACLGSIVYLLGAALGWHVAGGWSFQIAWTAAAVAWVCGFVVPGASAGMGVREVVLVALLGPVLTEPTALVLALLLRICTLAGDCLTYLVAEGTERAATRVDG
jgi:glycosyltransferase 2 family protein